MTDGSGFYEDDENPEDVQAVWDAACGNGAIGRATCQPCRRTAPPPVRRCAWCAANTHSPRFCSITCANQAHADRRAGMSKHTKPKLSAHQRGYGWSAHQRHRAAIKGTVDAGNGYCTEPVCLMRTRWIPPGTAWDLAHNRSTGEHRGPAHARCNRAEGARYRNATRRVAQRRPLPNW